jgi:hypothetical protein
VARYGVYAALAISTFSVWLGQQAGASLDFALMRAIFVFLAFTAMAFGAEALLSFSPLREPEERPEEVAEDAQHDD